MVAPRLDDPVMTTPSEAKWRCPSYSPLEGASGSPERAKSLAQPFSGVNEIVLAELPPPARHALHNAMQTISIW